MQNLVMLKNKGVITSIELVPPCPRLSFPDPSSCRLLKTLFPLLPRTTSSSLRSFIRKTILSDIRTANIRTKDHKLNRAVQTMLFGMVERGMDAEVVGDKGKAKTVAVGTDEAMWAIVLSRELWRKGVWYVCIIYLRFLLISCWTSFLKGGFQNCFYCRSWMFASCDESAERSYSFFLGCRG